MALEGYKSSSGFGGINYDYLADLPEIDYENPDQTGQDFQYTSAPLSGGGGDSGGVDTSALNVLANPFPDGDIPGMSYASGMGGMDPNASSTMPKTADEALGVLKSQVYNPGTKKFQPSTKYSYPGSTYMPERFNMIDKVLMFGSPNADTSSMDMKGILDNAAGSQALISQLMHDNPTAPLQQVMDSYHSHSTGFDVNTGEMLPQDPFNTQQTFDQFHQQNMQNNPDVHQGSVFDPGGLFSGSFSFDKGGPVSGGK